MIPRTLSAGTLAAAMALTAGCQAPDMSPSPGMRDPFRAPYHDPQITILSPEITNWIRFHPAMIRDQADQPLHVEIPVRNTTDRLYLIHYRFIFRDQEGFELEPLMGWHRAALRPKQTVYLKGTALSTDAANYKLEVKWAN